MNESCPSFATSSLTKKDYDVVVAGGGPGGLACAVSLASQGVRNIAVLECKSPTVDAAARGYCYRLDGHGGKWFAEVGLLDHLRQVSCKTPEETHFITLDGTKKSGPTPMRDIHQETFWLWRSDLLALLWRVLEERYPGLVDVHFDTKCVSLKRQETEGDGWALELTAVQSVAGTEQEVVLHPRFVVGADGVHSTIRQSLVEWDPRFVLRTVPHVTSGLWYKSLAVTVGEDIAPSGAHWVFIGVNGERFGFPPQRADRVRLAGCARWPQHPLWELPDTEAFYQYFQARWPQLDWRTAVTVDVAQSFVSSPALVFPPVTYCEALQWTMPTGTGRAGRPPLGAGCGAVLLGDAVHSFPPDIGQGVNSALEDVFVLHKALQHTGTLSDALPLFEQQRREDVRALALLFPIGAPYQYNVPWTLARVLWYMDFVVRLMGNRLFPFAISQPVGFGLQNPAHSYSDLLRGYQHSTIVLRGAFLLAAAALGLAVRAGGRAAALVAAALGVGGVAGVAGLACRQATYFGKPRR